MVLVCVSVFFVVGFWGCFLGFVLGVFLFLFLVFFLGGTLTAGVGSASNLRLFFLLNFILHHFEDVPLVECIYLHTKLTGES